MSTFAKYSKNLRREDDKIYSYSTMVAVIAGPDLIQVGYWSQTTQKHINYAARELNLNLVKR